MQIYLCGFAACHALSSKCDKPFNLFDPVALVGSQAFGVPSLDPAFCGDVQVYYALAVAEQLSTLQRLQARLKTAAGHLLTATQAGMVYSIPLVASNHLLGPQWPSNLSGNDASGLSVCMGNWKQRLNPANLAFHSPHQNAAADVVQVPS